jgi:alanine dehydrogenase
VSPVSPASPASPVGRDVIVLSGAELRQLLPLADVVPAIESAYVAAAGQQAALYPVVREPLPDFAAVFGIKSGYWPERGSLGLKVAGYWSGNRARGLDNHQAMIVLVDPATGVPRAIIDGNYITAIRTSAAGAVGLKHLARNDAQTALIIGTGVQAEAQARALDWWRPGIRLVAFEPFGSRPEDMTANLCARLAESGIACQPAGSLPEAAVAADIIVTTTPATRPVLPAEYLRVGVHVNAMGADTAGKQEHEVGTLRRALVVVDDWAQASRLGECQHAVAAGLFTGADHPHAIGEIIAGTAAGRADRDQITLFDATGLALQDLAAAELAIRLARERQLGRIISLD